MKLIQSHLGNGDLLAFADLIVRLADGERAMLTCWEENMVNAKSIFINHPNIEPFPAQDIALIDQAYQPEWIKLGHYSGVPRLEGEDMIEFVYRTAGRDHRERFENEVVRKATEKVGWHYAPSWTKLILVHDDESRSFKIDPSHFPSGNVLLANDFGLSILAYWRAIEMAAEIHCIDSAFLHLAEQLQPQGKLFYHAYARPSSESYNTLRHPWVVLE